MVQLTDKQFAAVKAAEEWFRSPNRKRIFRFFGAAGTGKSTTVRQLLDRLAVRSVTITLSGKAAEVLRKKGVPAQTAHSFLYAPILASADEIEELRGQINRIKSGLTKLSPAERYDQVIKMNELERKLEMKLTPGWSFRWEDEEEREENLPDLILIDELSMIGDDILRDLVRLNRPILAIGDPFQLPPVGYKSSLIEGEPDVLLTEVHRQALDNPILRLATDIREDRGVSPINEDKCFVTNQPISHLHSFLWENFDQIICGFHKTRRKINTGIRTARGLAGNEPFGSDKIICVKNHRFDDDGIIFNGQEIELSEVAKTYGESRYTNAKVKPCGIDEWEPKLTEIYLGHFADNYRPDEKRSERDYRIKSERKLLELDFGYAITCHKAQGSEWDRVCVIDDGFGRSYEDTKRWLYTAVTRPRTQLVLATGKV